MELVPVLKKTLVKNKITKDFLDSFPNIIVKTTNEDQDDESDSHLCKWIVDSHHRKEAYKPWIWLGKNFKKPNKFKAFHFT